MHITVDIYSESGEVLVHEEYDVGETVALRGDDYPSLVATWDNEDDAIYDTWGEDR